MTAIDDARLLDALGVALRPGPIEPGPEEIANLLTSLADRRARGPASGDGVVVPIGRARSRDARRWMHLHRPVAAAAAVAVLISGGTAAAAVATNTLPGPTRAVAFDLGLPVSSPALARTRGLMATLEAALASKDRANVQAGAVALRRSLAGLAPGDRAQVEVVAREVLDRADRFLEVEGTASPRSSASGRSGDKGDGGSGRGVGPSDDRRREGGDRSGGASSGPADGDQGSPGGHDGSSSGDDGSTDNGSPSPGGPGAPTGSAGGGHSEGSSEPDGSGGGGTTGPGADSGSDHGSPGGQTGEGQALLPGAPSGAGSSGNDR